MVTMLEVLSRSVRGALLTLLAASCAVLAACAGEGRDASTPPQAASPVPVVGHLPITANVTLYGAEAGDYADALAVGDFNGDGVRDVALAAAFADGPDNARLDGGEVYVFLGPFAPGQKRDAAKGEEDVTISGAAAGDQAGRGLAAGDFNGDGTSDLIVGAPYAHRPAGMMDAGADAGAAYVLFGSSSWGRDVTTIDLAAGADLAVYGANSGDLLGFAVVAARLNGDAADDLVIGAFWADGPQDERDMAGELYVVYGASGRGGAIDVAAAEEDVVVYGASAGDRLGEGVGAGDVNGDGVDDLILPAPFAASKTGVAAAGRTYVIYSGNDAPGRRTIDLAEGNSGPVVYGVDEGDQLGHVVAAGDVDGDGRDDVLLTAVSADGPGNTVDLAGEAALVLAKTLAASPEVDVAVGGADAVFYGADVQDRMGRSAATGDIDGDGRAEVILGAPGGAGPLEDAAAAGEVYWVRDAAARESLQMPEGALVYYGGHAGDGLGSEVFGRPPLVVTDVDGDGRDELLASAPNADGPDGSRPDAGLAVILFLERPG